MLQVINPATEQLIDSIETDTEASIAQKYARAKEAQPSWAKQNYSIRAQCLTKFAEGLHANRQQLAHTLTCEMGKPITQSLSEISGTIRNIEYFVQNVPMAIKDENFGVFEGDTREKITHEPLGVIANISAWNYPFFVGGNVFVPALLTGNAVLYKPSELSSLTGLQIAKLLHEAGVPKDIFAPVVGGKEVGDLLTDQPLAGIFFTGSKKTGLSIASKVAHKLIKVQLELGGKDAIYVRDDADVSKAAQSIAEGIFYNTGQGCCSVERIYVQDKIYDPFLSALSSATAALVVGDPQDKSTFIGPLARKEQLELLAQQTQQALSSGASLLCGGARVTRSGYFFAPTLLAKCTNKLSLMQDESFGPIAGLSSVKSDDAAIELINQSEYGLTAGVYTSSLERAQKILSQAQVGTAYVNCCDRVSPRLPWSGRKHSGIGSTLSWQGIQNFVQPKAWHIRTA